MNPIDFQPDSPGELVKISFPMRRPQGDSVEQAEGWAFVPKPPPLLSDILEQVAPLLRAMDEPLNTLGRLDGLFRQTPTGLNFSPWVLLRPLRVREARLSSRIENTVAAAAEVSLASMGQVQRVQPLEVNNYMRAIERAVEQQLPMNEATIRALHAQLLEKLPDAKRKFPGQYRPNQVFLGDETRGFEDARFVPPPATEVPRLMSDLVGYIRDPGGMPKLLAAGIAHYQFETIHPFADGNGRLGRMLVTLSLCGDGMLSEPLLYPSGYIEKHRQSYYDKLLRVSTHNEWGSWLEYFLTAVLEEAKATETLIIKLLQLRDKYLGLFNQTRLGQGIVGTIDHLFAEPVTSVAGLHGKISGAPQTARNYIERLVNHGVLVPYMKIGKEQFFAATEVLAIADQD